MRAKVSDDVREILVKAQKGLEAKFKVGDFVLIGSYNDEQKNYLRFGKLIKYEPREPYKNMVPTLGKGYNINIIVLPEVEILRAEHNTDFIQKTPNSYVLNDDELSKIINLLKETELEYLAECIKP